MRQYIISIAVSAVVSAIAGILAPDKWGKYIHIITGLVIALCIANPVFSILHSDIFAGFSVQDEISSQKGDEILKKEVAKELGLRVEKDIEDRIKSEYNRSNIAEAVISADDEGNIKGVEKIILYGDRITDEVRARLCEIYGTSEVIYGGAEKNFRAAE